MTEDQNEPSYALDFYYPTERFLAVREHVSVMDTSKTVPGGDGELVALFGPSECGGASAEEKAESLRQANLFLAAPDLLVALQAQDDLARLCWMRDNSFPDQGNIYDDDWRELAGRYEDVFVENDGWGWIIAKMETHVRNLRETALLKAKETNDYDT